MLQIYLHNNFQIYCSNSWWNILYFWRQVVKIWRRWYTVARIFYTGTRFEAVKMQRGGGNRESKIP